MKRRENGCQIKRDSDGSTAIDHDGRMGKLWVSQTAEALVMLMRARENAREEERYD